MFRSVVVFCLLTPCVFAATYYVDANNLSPEPPYDTWEKASANIQNAINQTVDGDIVWITNGTYVLSAEISITNAITVQSVNGPVETIISGNTSNSCFVLSDACVISGLTIKNGQATEGGGVHCLSSASVVSNCVISDNSADYGGGMFSGTALNCRVFNNSATSDGGGFYSTDVYNSLIVSNFSISYASAASRGNIINCTIADNTSGRYGVTLNGCIIKNSIVYYNEHSINGEIYGSDVYSSCKDSGYETDCIRDAPLFISGYQLADNSPCRSAGNYDYVIGEDLDGNAWRNSPSMGCFEVTAPVYINLVGPTNICAGTLASYQVEVVGSDEDVVVSFDDGWEMTNRFLIDKAWNSIGYFNVVVSVASNSYSLGRSITQHISVVSQNESVVYVSEKTGDDLLGGTSWEKAKRSIQAGIDAQYVFGGKVLVSNGVYNVSQPILVNNSIKVIAGSDPSLTVVDAGRKCSVFMLKGSGSTISGMTITGGDYDHFAYPSDVTYGGGVSCDNGNHIITNCVISGNKASYGGGGVFGGTVYDSVISNNGVANRNGGGLHGTMAYRCVIKDNMAGSGFGGGAYGGYLESCLIIGNHGSTGGGGLCQGEAVNCTIVNNTASSCGGVESSVVKNSIIHGNTRDFFGPHNLGGSSTFNSCSPDVSHGSNGNITNTVLFVDVAAENYRLSASSPCINAGHNDYTSTTDDLDGNARIVGEVVDVGAYERQDAGTDFDSDGIADLWEMNHCEGRHFTDPTTTSSNGVNNLRQAYIAGLDPNDPDSEFTTDVLLGGILQWQPSVSGRVYSVQWSTNLLDGFQPLETEIPWTQSSYTHSNAPPCIYYKVDVQLVE